MARTKRKIFARKIEEFSIQFRQKLERGLIQHNVKMRKGGGFYKFWDDVWHPLGKKRIKQIRSRYDRRFTKQNLEKKVFETVNNRKEIESK